MRLVRDVRRPGDRATCPGAQLVAVADADLELAQRPRSTQIPGARPAPDLDNLLSEHGVDVVVITTPPWTHADLAVQALDAGATSSSRSPWPSTSPAVVASLTRRAPTTASLPSITCCASPRSSSPSTGCWPWSPVASVCSGAVRRFSFENDATDDGLPAEHWFWDAGALRGHLRRARRALLRPGLLAYRLRGRIGPGDHHRLVDDNRIDTVCATAIFESPSNGHVVPLVLPSPPMRTPADATRPRHGGVPARRLDPPRVTHRCVERSRRYCGAQGRCTNIWQTSSAS